MACTVSTESRRTGASRRGPSAPGKATRAPPGAATTTPRSPLNNPLARSVARDQDGTTEVEAGRQGLGGREGVLHQAVPSRDAEGATPVGAQHPHVGQGLEGLVHLSPSARCGPVPPLRRPPRPRPPGRRGRRPARRSRPSAGHRRRGPSRRRRRRPGLRTTAPRRRRRHRRARLGRSGRSANPEGSGSSATAPTRTPPTVRREPDALRWRRRWPGRRCRPAPNQPPRWPAARGRPPG